MADVSSQARVGDLVEVQGGLHSEVRVLSVLSQFAVMQVVLAAAGLVRNKIVAYRLGPEAFGEIVQIAAVAGTIGSLVTFGMGVALRRNAATARTLEQRQAQVESANAIVLTLASLACAVSAFLLLSGQLLPVAGLAETAASFAATAIFIAAIPIEALRTNYQAALEGILDVKGLAVRRSVAVLLATAIAIPVVWLFGFIGAAVQYLALSAFVAALLALRCRKLGYFPLRVSFDRRVVAQLASFGLVSLASGFALSLSDTAVRTSLIRSAGAAANGLLQAPYMLSVTVKGIVLASIGSVSLATIAAQGDRAAVAPSVDRLLNVVVPVGTAALGLLGLFGSTALTILYSSSFAGGAALFPFLLSADLLMVFVWVIGSPLLAFGDRSLWLALDLLFAFSRWALAILLLARFGALAVVLGYSGAMILHAALNVAIFRFRYRLQLRGAQLLSLVIGVGLVAALSVIGSRPVSPVPFAAGLLAWLAYTAHHARRMLLPELRRRLSSRAPGGGR
jgi:O-antigen/teichoic acid export membrane protein